MGCAGSKDGKQGTKLATKGLMKGANLAAKVGANEIGNIEDLGDGGQFLEGATKVAAKVAIKQAGKQLEDKDDKKSDHDKETKSKKDNIKMGTKLIGNAASVAASIAEDD